FPDKRDEILGFLAEEKEKRPELADIDFIQDIVEPFDAAMHRRAVDVQWSRYACVGFSLVFGQTMASMLMAKLIKQSAPRTLIIAGGPSCSGKVGESLLKMFPQLDLVINGEGELPLTQMIKRIQTGQHNFADIPAVASRKSPPASS